MLSCGSLLALGFGEDFTATKIEKKWMVTLYHANSYRPGAHPTTLLVPEGGVGFEFLSTPDMAMLTTKHPSYNGTLLGDLTAKAVSAKVRVIRMSDPAPSFTYYGWQGPAPGGFVRLYFRTLDPALGESQYWWSNQARCDFDVMASSPFFCMLWAPLEGQYWSDREGCLGTTCSTAFTTAVADVQEIGLSYGGDGLWAFGVGVSSGSATFQLAYFSVD